MTDPAGVVTAPHTLDDLLDAARGDGVAEPSEIRVRPELRDRMQREAAWSCVPVTLDAHGGIRCLDGIPVEVDPELPAFPGYEIHRAGPGSEAKAA
jgi:hypothetical protein